MKTFLDDPQLHAKHRKRLAKVEAGRALVQAKWDRAKRLTAADYAVTILPIPDQTETI